MLRYLVAGALFVALAGCSVAPKDAPQAAYEGTAAFATTLKAANTYAAMPRCSLTVKPPCSSQVAVNKIVVAANRADAAVTAAQHIAADTTSTKSDWEKAVAAANEAVAALAKIIPAS